MTALRLFAFLGSVLLLAACDGTPSTTDGDVDADGSVNPQLDGGDPDRDGGGADEDGGSTMREDGGPGCTDVCTVSTERCSGVEIQRCIIDPETRCTVWAAPEACGGGLVCSGDECTDTCTDACTEGERRCASGSGYQVCALQSSGCTEWGAESACPSEQVCEGAGVCMACTEGAERCGPSGDIQTCTGGLWALTATCPFGCDACGPSCRDSVTCTPGTYQCNGSNVETCNATGTAWLHVSSCAVNCSAGLCTGACTPGATRCNAGGVETCNAAGTAWTLTSSCTTFCDAGLCALDGLLIASNQTMEGEVLVDGAFVVRSGATLTASGPLTIRADSITVDHGASISVAPAGDSPEGAGKQGISATTSAYGGGGGGYGTQGGGYSSLRGAVWGSSVDSEVRPGSRGGQGITASGGAGGAGGGVLRLIADTITINGQLTANGQPGTSATYSGGGGSGGGILIAGDQVRIAGAVSALGGSGGTGSYNGGAGGNGRVKILYGADLDTTGATFSGTVTQGLLPPLVIRSSTHPDPDLVYNDGFEVVAMSWERPFSPITGYYWHVHQNIVVPTPANGTFAATSWAFRPEPTRSGSPIPTIRPTSGWSPSPPAP